MGAWKTSPNDLGRAGTCSDRALEKAIQLRLNLLYFIDHEIGEAPPDHSTICKTRKRIPTDVFEKVFSHILGLCVSAGLVKGEIQSIDTAYINANASFDKMVEVKMIDRDLMEYLNELKAQDDPTDDCHGPIRNWTKIGILKLNFSYEKKIQKTYPRRKRADYP